VTAKRDPVRRRRRSGLRPKLRARLAQGIPHDESLANHFRGLLIQEMIRRGVWESDLARECGCSVENIYQILDAERGLRFDTAERLCRSLGLRLIMTLQEEPQNEQV
jgi:DNA-binding phage protein